MVFIKKVVNSDAGDADHVGGDDWDILDDYYSDTDITGPALINTETKYRKNILKIGDTSNDHWVAISNGEQAADRTASIPVLAGNDEFTFNAETQTLTNKTISGASNTITNIGTSSLSNGSVTYAKIQDTAATDRLIGRDTAGTGSVEELAVSGGIEFTGSGGIQTSAFSGDVTKSAGGTSTTIANNAVTDAKINTHTTTKITTTSKSLLNTAIVYNDQTNSFGDFAQVFKDDKLQINNPADTFAYTLVGSAIAAARNLTLPLITSDDTLAVLALAQTLQNKTIDGGVAYANSNVNILKGTGADNPYSGAGTSATLRRTGLWHSMTSTGGDGMWSTSVTAIGTNNGQRDATEGRYQDYATGATTGNNAGLRQAILLYRRDWSSYMITRIAVSSTSSIRIFIGWSSDQNEVAGEDPLNGFSGAGIGKRSADTNWQTIHNDGTGATNFDDTGIALTTSFTTIEMQLDGTNFQAKIGGSSVTAVTTELPAATTGMAAHVQIETAANSDKTISICPIYSRVGT